MKLVGAIRIPESAYPTSWVIYDDRSSGGGVSAVPLDFYGVVAMDGDDAPGRLVPMVASHGRDGVLRPIWDVDLAAVIHGVDGPEEAVRSWLGKPEEQPA